MEKFSKAEAVRRGLQWLEKAADIMDKSVHDPDTAQREFNEYLKQGDPEETLIFVGAACDLASRTIPFLLRAVLMANLSMEPAREAAAAGAHH